MTTRGAGCDTARLQTDQQKKSPTRIFAPSVCASIGVGSGVCRRFNQAFTSPGPDKAPGFIARIRGANMGMQLRMRCQKLIFGEIFAEECSRGRANRIPGASWGRCDRDDVIAESQMHDCERFVVRRISMGGGRDGQQQSRERNAAQSGAWRRASESRIAPSRIDTARAPAKSTWTYVKDHPGRSATRALMD